MSADFIIVHQLFDGPAAIIIGILLCLFALKFLKEKQMIENIPTSKIRSIAMGLVEINGTSIGDQQLVAPLSGLPCYYYHYKVDERVYDRYSRSSNKRTWRNLFSETKNVLFYLQDETGYVLINPEGANISVTPSIELDVQKILGIGKDVPESIKTFMTSKGINVEGKLGFSGHYRFYEYILKPKDKMYVMGSAGDNPYIKDGTATEGSKDIMISKGNPKKFFYISDKPESKILKSYTYNPSLTVC